jgi:hypothetical protein
MKIRIEAARRLLADLQTAMSETRKDAITKLRDNTRITLIDHFILINLLPDNSEIPHWQKECRTLLEQTLRKTYLKAGKILPLSDFLFIIWEGVAEPMDCVIAAKHILQKEEIPASIRRRLIDTADFTTISEDYKKWLTKWYLYYNDVHSKTRFELPESVF